jgi:hypothetical protein
MTGTIAAVLALTLSSTAGSDLAGVSAGDVAPPTAQIRFVGEPDLRLQLHQTSAGREADVLAPLRPSWRPLYRGVLEAGASREVPSGTYRLSLARDSVPVLPPPAPQFVSGPVVVEARVEHHLLGRVLGWGFLGLGGVAVSVMGSVMSTDINNRISDGVALGVLSGSVASAALGGLLLWVSEDELAVDIRPDT